MARVRTDERRWRVARVHSHHGTWYRVEVQDYPGDSWNSLAGIVEKSGNSWTAQRAFFASNPPDEITTEHKTKREAVEALLEWDGLDASQKVGAR